LTPWPGVTVQFRGQPLKILRVMEVTAKSEGEPGTLSDAAAGLVRCGGGSLLKLLEVQPAGGKAMPWAAFASGRQPKNGEALTGGPTVQEKPA
jgi:methionyl-tRNA formyltransferase